MSKIVFLNSVANLINKIREKYSDELLQQIAEKFEKYLSVHPYDTEIWLKYVLLFFKFSYDDD